MRTDRKGLRIIVLFVMALILHESAAAGPADEGGDRGRMLYTNHCLVCHDSVVHLRTDRRAQSVEDVARWVRHWSDIQQLDWSDEDVEAVADYLDRRFYRFSDRKPPLPPSVRRDAQPGASTSGLPDGGAAGAFVSLPAGVTAYREAR